MTRTNKLLAVCAFAFGLTFASSAFAACNARCFDTCQTSDRCYLDVTYAHCYRQCGCIIP